MSTTRPGLSASRSSTRHVVVAPVALFVTCNVVPKGSVGLAQVPDGASAYHVAPPVSESDPCAAVCTAWFCATTALAGVVVVVVVGAGALVVVVTGGAVVVVVAGGAVVVVGVEADASERE
jgi:hypothetical protein